MRQQALFMSAGGSADASFSSVKLLMGFEGVNGATTFVDESSSPRTVSGATGGATHIVTAQFKYGASSCLFNGTNDGIRVISTANTDFNALAASWTFESFIRFNSLAGDQSIFGMWNPPSDGYLFRFNASSLDWFAFGGTNYTSAWSPSTNTWYHVCVECNGSKTRTYVDGAMIGSTAAAQTGAGTGSADFAIGAQGASAGGANGRFFNGWQDEFRYTRGTARYNSDAGFTVPAAAFPRS